MKKDNQFVAFIPLRGGSKSIPLKNIKEINNQPLAYWTIDAAVNSKYIDKVYVSTDSPEIIDVISKYKKINSHKIHVVERSPKTATDEASTESAMIEFAQKFIFEHIILIQATNPLLTNNDLDVAIKRYQENNNDSMLSLVRQKRFFWKEEIDGIVEPENYRLDKRPRRQEYQGVLVENGSFYITKRDLLLNTGVRISGNIGYYEMSEDSYFEIDEPSDWIVLEQLMKRKYSNKDLESMKNIKLFAMDCDGVLTDAGMYYSEKGDELKKFNTKDGMGISLLHKLGVITAIITGENTNIVQNRANKLGINNVFLGITNKVAAMEKLLKLYSLSYDDVAYIGDDINDLDLLKKVRYSFSVNDGMDIVKNNVNYVTKANGGQGAVREVAELILNHKISEV